MKAAQYGHEHIVRELVFERTKQWDICSTMMTNVATLAKDIMVTAARGGQEALVRTCYNEWGATCTDETLCAAARSGHEKLFRYLLKLLEDQGEIETEDIVMDILSQAEIGGHTHLVRLCLNELDATCADVVSIMPRAARCGHMDILRLCYDRFANDYDRFGDKLGVYDLSDVMRLAATHGHTDIVRMCYDEWHVTDVATTNAVLLSAASRGDTEVVRLCGEQWGATDFLPATTAAYAHGHYNCALICVTFCQKHIAHLLEQQRTS